MAPPLLADGAVDFGPRIVVDSSTINPRTVVAGDLDRDGDTDLAVCYTNGNKILWFENEPTSPAGFIARLIDDTAQDTRELWLADATGNGALDVVSMSFLGSVRVYENDGQPDPVFTRHIVAPAPSGWSVCAADMDNDGDIDLAAVEKANTRAVHWYRNTGGPPTEWEKIQIDDNMFIGEKVIPADVDGDGDNDLLVASFGVAPGNAPPEDPRDGLLTWYRNDGAADPTFERITLASLAYGGKWVETGDYDNDGDLDIAAANQQNGKIEWWESDGAPTPSFTRRFITSLVQVKGVTSVDLDFDGDTDLIANGIVTDEILFIENTGGVPPVFVPHVITNDNANPLTAVPADLDGDGDIDIASVSFLDGTVNWFNNQSPPVGIEFTQAPYSQPTGSTPKAFAQGDLDRDGRTDLVVTSPGDNGVWWHRNLGGSPVTFEQRLVSSAFTSPERAVVTDIDRDGDADIISTASGSNTVVWHRNDAGTPIVWTSTAIGGTVPGAHALGAADVDRDGDTDLIVGSSTGDIILLEHNGAPSPLFTARVIGTTPSTRVEFDTGDLNHDGTIDIVVASRDTDSVLVLVNDGAATPQFFPATLEGTVPSPLDVHLVDYDTDGDLDILSGSSSDGTITLHENTNPITPEFALSILISGHAGLHSIVTTDADHDGDIDILASGSDIGGVIWYERTAPGTLTPNALFPVNGEPAGVALADINADSIPDILSLDALQNQIQLQLSGTYPIAISARLSAITIAPPDLPEGEIKGLFTLEIEHHTASELASFEINSLPISATDADGIPVSDTTLNAIVDSVPVYIDDGSGVFEEENDTLLANNQNPVFDAAGNFTVSFGPDLSLSPDESLTLHIGVELESIAAESGAGQLRFLIRPAETALTQAGAPGVSRDAGPPVQTPPLRAVPNTQGRTVGAPWLRHTIDDTFLGAESVHTADMNDDGLPDLIVGWEQQGSTVMYLNPGTELSTGTWPRTITGIAAAVETAIPVDLDADGRLDIVNAREIGGVTIHWAPPAPLSIEDRDNWSTMTIPNIPNERWGPIEAADIDGQHGPDLVFGALGVGGDFDVPLAWLKAPANPRDAGTWTYHLLTDAAFVTSIILRDMDADGDTDVAWTNRLLQSTERAAWWLENPGPGAAQTKIWPRRLIGSLGREPMIMDLADIDGDGLEDAVVPDRNFAPDWHRRLDATGTAWSTHRLNWPTDLGRPKAFRVGDINLDGKPDIVATAIQAIEANDVVGVCWLEQPPNPQSAQWTALNISGFGGEKFDRIELLDLDGDGDLDIVTTEERNNSDKIFGLGVVWYENPTIELHGDVNRDGRTNSSDLALLLSNWGSMNPLLGMDLNNDGTVNSTDLAIVLASWNHTDQDYKPPTP